MEPVTHTVTDRKQSNDRGCKSLVQQSLEYRPWLRGWRPQSPPTATADSRQVGAALSLTARLPSTAAPGAPAWTPAEDSSSGSGSRLGLEPSAEMKTLSA
jgi:hypothetical protein